MRIRLDLINEDQSVFLLLHFIAVEHADLQIEILYRFGFCKQSCAKRVLYHIDFDKIRKQFISNMPDNICFADLSRSVYQKDLRRAGFQVFFN